MTTLPDPKLMAAGDGKPVLPPKPPGRLYRMWDSDIFYSYLSLIHI